MQCIALQTTLTRRLWVELSGSALAMDDGSFTDSDCATEPEPLGTANDGVVSRDATRLGVNFLRFTGGASDVGGSGSTPSGPTERRPT